MELVKAGEPVPVTLTLYPTSNLFMPGQEAIGRERGRVVADNTVFHERGRASRVVLPITQVGSSTGSS